MHLTRRQSSILILLAIGVGVCCVVYPHSPAFNRAIPQEAWRFEDDVWIERILVAVAAIIALIPATRAWIVKWLDALRTPSPKAKRWIALAVFLLSQPLLYALAAVRGRVLQPYWHDENFYRLQTTFLAHGRLWMPGLALPDFFDVPYVFTRPVYAVAYFPGTALLHVPGVWLHLPYFIMPLFVAGITLSLLYLIAVELVDGVAGLLAVTLMLSLALFRWMALVEMSHAAGAMWGLIAIWSWLAWRRSRAMRWVALAALAAGWYAITRPLDCALVLLPVAVAWAWDFHKVAWRVRGRAIALAVAVSVAIILPFLAMQLIFDRAITGHWLGTPMGLYYRTYMNLKGIGLEHYDPAFVPPTASRLIRDTYGGIVAPRMRDFSTVRGAAKLWFTVRLPESFGTSLPSLLLIILVPAALLRLRDRRVRVICLALLCYIAGSGFVFQYLDHYAMAIAPMVIILVLVGASELARAFPARRVAAAFLPVAIFLLAMHRLWLNDQGAYQRLGHGLMWANYVMIPREVSRPALVFFRYGSAERYGAFDDEPAYNWDVLNPDDARIVRANDLGPKQDIELLRHYEKTRPKLHVYLFERATLKLDDLGSLRQAEEKLIASEADR